MIEDLYKKRKQIKDFSDKLPPEGLVEDLIYKTYQCVPSKQNLMPYKIHVIGPEDKKTKEALYELASFTADDYVGTRANRQVFAPYNLIFTNRLAFPNDWVLNKLNNGHRNASCDPDDYDKWGSRIGSTVEVGLFASILVGLCMENDLDISFLRCFPPWHSDLWKKLPFVDQFPILGLCIGYKDENKKMHVRPGETKPDFDEVVYFEHE